MPTTTVQSCTVTTENTRPTATRRLLLVAGAAVTVGSVAVELLATAARGLGVTLAAGEYGAAHAAALGVGALATGVLICSFWGTLLALVLNHRARRPRRTFIRTTVTLTALSLVSPLTATATPGARATLLAGHLVAAAIVIPLIARALPVRKL